MYVYVCNSMMLTLIYHFKPDQDVFLNLTEIFSVCLIHLSLVHCSGQFILETVNYVVLGVTPNLSIKSWNDYYLSQWLTKKANFTVSIVPLLQCFFTEKMCWESNTCISLLSSCQWKIISSQYNLSCIKGVGSNSGERPLIVKSPGRQISTIKLGVQRSLWTVLKLNTITQGFL